jgi:hypothetical protein
LGKLNLLQSSNSCQIAKNWNTSAKLGRAFRISNINLNLILYNCTEAARLDDRGLVETKMGCGNQHKVFVSMGGRYDETSDYGGYAVEGCDAFVMPVLGSSGEANASHYEQLISNGFLLTWDQPLPPRKFARQIIFYLDFPYHINRASTNYTSAPFLIRAITSFTREERRQITLASHFFKFSMR